MYGSIRARKPNLWLAILMVLSLVLAACGQQGGGGGQQTGGTTPAAGGTQPAAPAMGVTPTGATAPGIGTTPTTGGGGMEQPGMTGTGTAGTGAGGATGGMSPVEGEGGPVTLLAQWSGEEKAGMTAVLKWCDENYNTQAKYEQVQNIGDALATRVEGGNPPDVATVSSPGLVQQYAEGGAAKPLDFLDPALVEQNLAPFWIELGSVEGKLYTVYMKAANKSLVWYSPKRFKQAKYEIPQSYDEMVQLSEKIAQGGKKPWAFGVQDAWTLTDFFENVYLRIGGPEKYDQLIAHEIPWTDPSVKQTFEAMNRIIAKDEFIAGGRSAALGQGWSAAATSVFKNPPAAEMFQEADFVGAAMKQELPNLKAGQDFDAFAFPPVGEGGDVTPVVVGPDGALMFNDTPGARALMRCFVDPRSTEQWAKRGGYTSPNKNVSMDVYPTETSKRLAKMVVDAGNAGQLRMDGSDQMVPQFSEYFGTALQNYFKNPTELDPLLEDLESKATRFYRGR